MHRVRDPELFEAQLDAPLKIGDEVSDAELEADASAFMAFAAAVGVTPPESAQVVPSANSDAPEG